MSKTGGAASLGVLDPVHPGDLLRPRLRGWLHLVAAPVALVAGIVLIAHGSPHRLAVTVYTVSVVGLFTTSALYHRVTWTPRARRRMKRLDHSMIFVLIAGSYTGFAAFALDKGAFKEILTLAWVGALAGVAFRMLWPSAPRWVMTPPYVALGSVAVFWLPEMIHGAGVAAVVLVIVSGLVYTVGAAAYATRWPDLSPTTFGYHEVFHACTLVGALLHYLAIWLALP
ncbi:MAG: hemolysin [Frankiaceae bacterium]|nr:hemolysin [Frankiaceae bacterium]MDQ1671896.1 hemolysin [Frankiaceae bacterium]